MLSIRFSRIGKKNQPHYRINVMEKSKDPYGKALEILGSYNPKSKELQINEERVNYWISVGAQMTPTVNNLLVGKNIVKGEKVRAAKSGKKKEEEKKADSGEQKLAEATETKAEAPKEEAVQKEKKEEPKSDEAENKA